MKVPKPLLSVIVANYNSEPYLRDCLDSILNQTYKNIEIIVNDDCSTDKSPRIIKEYEEKYPRIVKATYNSINKGVAKTRHEAILKSNSDYITTLDSDDYYYDNQKLENEIGLILWYKEKTSKDIIAYSNILQVENDKTLIGIQGNSKNMKEGNIFHRIVTRSCLIPRDFIMKKNLYFEVGGYDSNFSMYEDWDLKIRLSKLYMFYYTRINGTAYRRHQSGLSALPILGHIKWMKRVVRKNKKIISRTEKIIIYRNITLLRVDTFYQKNT